MQCPCKKTTGRDFLQGNRANKWDFVKPAQFNSVNTVRFRFKSSYRPLTSVYLQYNSRIQQVKYLVLGKISVTENQEIMSRVDSMIMSKEKPKQKLENVLNLCPIQETLQQQ
ncbi:hypothetical protein ILYODFUR_024459 [Ilyodon furcidens]|uniref:Uncharacterized protein n=1 Tax=Ilyodon furcidens TaxID=33524 RepID=A0ABV0T318_9TELE